MDELEVRKKTAESENKKMFRSRFDIFVLNALNDKDGASYGYDVINYIQNKTKGHYKIKTFSTIYNTLKRLEEQKLVISTTGDGETNGAQRVYYTLTDLGKKYLEENKQEYKYLRTLLDNLLTDEDFDLENEQAPYRASDLKPLTKRNRSYDETSDDSTDSIQEVAASTENSVDTAEKSVVSQEIAPKVQSVSPKRKTYSASDVEYKAVFDKIITPTLTNPSQSAKNQPKTKSVSTKSTQVKSNNIAESKANSTQTVKDNTSAVVKDNKEEDIEQNNLDKFRSSLRSEGFTLNTYLGNKENTGVKYLYVNRIMRDTVVLSALVMIISVLVLYLLKNVFNFSITAFGTIVGIDLAIILCAIFVWYRKPDKRRRDTVNLKIINLACVGFFTVFFALDIIITLVLPNGKGLNSAEIYAPVIVASTSLFVALIFNILYKSGNYFQKK